MHVPYWRDCLACRECKRALVLYLGQSFKQFAVGTCRLREHQKVILAGCFSGVEEDQAWKVTTGGVQPVPTLSCGAEEADTRVWLHVLRSPGTRKLVCSPDTDVYHIGLPLMCNQPLDVFVRISVFSSQEHRYLSLKILTMSLQGDPDLSSVPGEILPKVLQTLFISTGCDYVSYFAGFGKSTFLKLFFQHASFINDVSQGTLASTCDSSRQLGFLSFVRLIGTVYFKKHLSTFKYDCPRALLNSFPCSDPISQHKQWLDCIRSTVWENIEFEDELPPSWEALWRHWLRSCWVSHFWSQACNSTYHLLDVNNFGWKVVEGSLEIDWDDPRNAEQVKESVRLLLRGCKCKKGCNNRRCSCFKAGVKCGPGCRCANCENLPSSKSQPDESEGNQVEQQELQDDRSLRLAYNSELVDVDGAEATHELEENLSEEDT